jgi:TetR/AcrR family transcriptional regulator
VRRIYGSVSPVRKSQPRALVTKESVLKASIAEFAEAGPDGARVERIAARAGVNKQALYYYFGSKEALFQAALASVYERIKIRAGDWEQTKLPPQEAMRDLVGAIFEEFGIGAEELSLISHENQRLGIDLDENLRNRMSARVHPIIDSVTHLLKRGQRQGVFIRDVTGKDLYLTIAALCMFYHTHAYTLSAILERDLRDPKNVALWKKHVQNFVLSGLRREPTA